MIVGIRLGVENVCLFIFCFRDSFPACELLEAVLKSPFTAPVLATADSMGRTALQIAQKSGNRAAAELLSCRTQQHKWSGQHRTMRKQQHTQEQQWAC